MTAAVAVLTLATAGTALAALSPSQYRSQAAVICKASSAKLSKIKSPKSAAGYNKFFKAALPIFRVQYAGLKKLKPPKALSFLHSKALSLEKTQLDGIQALIRQIDGGADPAKAYKATDAKLTRVGNAETATWKKLKIDACANI